jgi:hypothetical protein
MSASLVSPVFGGRRAELSALSALLDRAAGAQQAFAIVSGEAGVGKTRLIGELTARATEAGFLVLTGQCDDLAAGCPRPRDLRLCGATDRHLWHAAR